MSPTSPLDNEHLVRQLARLAEINVTLNSTLDPEKLLKFIMEAAAEILDCEATSILLYDEQRRNLFFASATGSDPQQLAQIPVPLEGSIAGTIFRENRPLLINNVEQDPRHYQQVGDSIQFQTHSLLGVPMRIKSKVTGVLEALNKRRGPFNESDTRLLSVIASQAAVAIHNARLVHELQRAYEEISRVEKMKSDFIAIASHELRTPLGVILGYAEFLKEEAQGEMSEHASMVLNSAIKLRVLVEDMTNMNMMQMGAAKLKLQVIAVQDVIQSVVDELAHTAQARAQKMIRNLTPHTIKVKADPEKLSLVLTNILNNAVRFTPEGGTILINLKAERGNALIEVRDNGIGIPTTELENIFKDFYQVEDHMRRRHGGMGLGLSIARGIVKLHKGRIWAESKGEGQGASIFVQIPLVS
jgi:signal transduction histidine kinase